MFGLKLRETHIVKIIEESLAKLSRHGDVDIKLNNFLENDVVWIDHEQMVTVFFDLELNAVEAMQHGGSLTIAIEGDERQVVITLTDTGVGITEENRQLLFTPFFTTKPIGDGTGLGLPSAYAAIKAHRGDISIKSNTDPKQGPAGTTVRITLPRRQILQNKESKMIVHEE